jgi:hypothetical protein
MKIPFLAVALIASIAVAPPTLAAAKKKQKVASRAAVATSMPRPAADPHAVYVSGEYVGRDPDPNIRAYLTRNPHDWDGPD